MLILSRKAQQAIVIGSDIVVTVVAVNRNRVKIGIEAPNNVRVVRRELLPYDLETRDGPVLDAGSTPPEMQALANAPLAVR
jgi:carbon storage regulator